MKYIYRRYHSWWNKYCCESRIEHGSKLIFQTSYRLVLLLEPRYRESSSSSVSPTPVPSLLGGVIPFMSVAVTVSAVP